MPRSRNEHNMSPLIYLFRVRVRVKVRVRVRLGFLDIGLGLGLGLGVYAIMQKYYKNCAKLFV